MNPSMSVTKVGLANRLNNFLAAQSLQRLIAGKTTIDLKKEINARKTIVFNLSKGKLWTKVAKIYGRFVLTTLLNLTLARADIPEKSRVPCHFYVDECHNYLSESFTEVFSEGRKYRVYLTVATQVIGQGMTTEMQRNILGNTNVKIIWKAGYESRNEMIRQMGVTEKWFDKHRITKDSFKRLKVGTFITQVDIHPPHKFRVPTLLLGNKNSMKEQDWKKILNYHKKRFYAPPFYLKTSVPNPQQNKVSQNSQFHKDREKLLNEEQFWWTATKRPFKKKL